LFATVELADLGEVNFGELVPRLGVFFVGNRTIAKLSFCEEVIPALQSTSELGKVSPGISYVESD
jgi:hypothetical protein